MDNNYKCESCARKMKNSDGNYVRCAILGSIRKRRECDKYADKSKIVKARKVDMLDWCD